MRRLGIGLFLGVLSLVCLPVLVAAQGVKVGYVDLQLALTDSNAEKKAKEAFSAEMNRMEITLEDRKKKVETLKNELEKKALLLKPEEQTELESQYRVEIREFQRLYEDSKKELEIKDREMTSRILVELRHIISDMGQQGDFALILEGNNTVVLYGAETINLTESVISAYNKRGTKIA
jgi:outer membrane protein